MKGCLSLILKTIFAILVFFGLKYLGVIDYISDKINENNKTSQENQIDKSQDIVDLSQINDEYVIDKSLKVLNNRVILAQHKATNQKMIMLLPKKENLLTKKDIDENNIQEKVDNLVKKYKNKMLTINKIEVLGKGSFNGLGQTIPYIKMSADISNLPFKDIEGIIGVAELNNGKNLVIASINEKNKYSNIITEAFFDKVKDNTSPEDNIQNND